MLSDHLKMVPNSVAAIRKRCYPKLVGTFGVVVFVSLLYSAHEFAAGTDHHLRTEVIAKPAKQIGTSPTRGGITETVRESIAKSAAEIKAKPTERSVIQPPKQIKGSIMKPAEESNNESAADITLNPAAEHFKGHSSTLPKKDTQPQEQDIYAHSRSLHETEALIAEAQRISEQILDNVIGNKTKVVLMDLATIENKGDPAISLGQLYLLTRLDLEIIYYCDYYCNQDGFDKGKVVAQEYNASDVIVMSTGGGNFGGYPGRDHSRIQMLKTFHDYQFVLLSQSTWFWDVDHLQECITEYSRHPDLTILLRDETSYNFTQKNFPAVRSILAPDMVFNIGTVKRFMPPLYDVLWVQRSDRESPGKIVARLPQGNSFVRGDWFGPWPTPRSRNHIDDTVMRTYNGFLFLLRGKIVITDRLHGFILSQLLDIPTVIIDNKIKKDQQLSQHVGFWFGARCHGNK